MAAAPVAAAPVVADAAMKEVGLRHRCGIGQRWPWFLRRDIQLIQANLSELAWPFWSSFSNNQMFVSGSSARQRWNQLRKRQRRQLHQPLLFVFHLLQHLQLVG